MGKKPYIISTFSGKKGELPSARLVGEGGGGGGGAVSSVNGKTGAVVLTVSDLDDSFKEALLDCFANVAWATEDGQQYYDALEAALYSIDHITAVYTQSGTVYDTDSLDSLKADLVVTAFYQGGGSKVVTGYTLNGTLTVGTSTITVSYGGKTTTFTVTVTESALYTLTENDFLRGYGCTGSYNVNEPHYAGTASARISYNKFDILLTPGKKYSVVAVSNYNTAQMGVQYFNESALATVANSGTIAANDIDTSSGWVNMSVEITVPESFNGSPCAGARFTWRQSDQNPGISNDFKVTSLTINEVTE